MFDIISTENDVSASCMIFPHKSVDVSALSAHKVHVKCALKRTKIVVVGVSTPYSVGKRVHSLGG